MMQIRSNFGFFFEKTGDCCGCASIFSTRRLFWAILRFSAVICCGFASIFRRPVQTAPIAADSQQSPRRSVCMSETIDQASPQSRRSLLVRAFLRLSLPRFTLFLPASPRPVSYFANIGRPLLLCPSLIDIPFLCANAQYISSFHQYLFPPMKAYTESVFKLACQ
ncbi:hypothetical protein QWJ34_08895 [Saccharibacillus sp. CPCC 101409]|uniref:hypothetical protein n=1 Tax=Saccharibacillus sp. CPCC 101409 TaxID=3058041 RepID=UPI0026740BB3|nr:hypothetical protein [Saccharibacillus sp. CPCC 101409]MDO3409877.1 hypothetical protein [Saccharibacillus sp. CPCC 101409]